MCSWANREILFANVNDQSTKIILRDYGCGATDNGRPTYQVCKVKKISSYFIWVTEIDTTKNSLACLETSYCKMICPYFPGISPEQDIAFLSFRRRRNFKHIII